MKMFVFEGSPEEIAKVAKTMGATPPPIKSMNTTTKPTKTSSKPNKFGESPEKFVTKKYATRVLTRLELSPPVIAVIKKLLAAGDNWVSSQDLYDVSKYKPAQFAGMMGAFGRRMYHTKGYDEEAHFWDYKKCENDGSWQYRLPLSVREAVKDLDSFKQQN